MSNGLPVGDWHKGIKKFPGTVCAAPQGDEP